MSDQDYDRNLFGEIERFIKVRIIDREYEIPDRLELLRVFQFLDFSIDYARLCWNGSCQRCLVTFELNGKKKESLSCRLKSCEKMAILKLPMAIKPAGDAKEE
jgi:hypothetical protein